MNNSVISVLVAKLLLFVVIVLTSTEVTYQRLNILRDVIRKKSQFGAGFSPNEQKLKVYQAEKFKSDEMFDAHRSKPINIDRTYSSDGITGYNTKNERNRVKGFKVLFDRKSISTVIQQKGNAVSKRIRKDIDFVDRNTSVLLECEVPSLSCRNCCNNNSNNCTHKTKFCRCDPYCTFYNDCCVDYKTFCGKKQKFSFGVEHVGLACESLKNAVWEDAQPRRLWMVVKCPRNRSVDEISRMCENIDNLQLNITNLQKLIPVVGKNNLTFRNEFCAKCNGIERFKHFGFELRLSCSMNRTVWITSFSQLSEFAWNNCVWPQSLAIRNLSQPVRECNEYFRNVCPTMNEVNESCHRSSDCISKVHWCNLMESKWDENASDKCRIPISFEPLERSDSPLALPESIRKVIQVIDRPIEIQIPRVNRCDLKGQFYDTYLEICRYGEAINLLVKHNLEKFDIVVWLSNKNISSDHFPALLDQVLSSLAELFNFEIPQVTAPEYVSTVNNHVLVIRFQLELTNEQTLRLKKDNQTTDFLSHSANTSRISSKTLPLRRLLFFTKEFNITIFNETFTVFKTTSRQLVCIQKMTYPNGSYTSLDNEKYYINSTGETFSKNQVFFEDNKNGSISVCERVVFASCFGRRINLTSEEYVKFDNLSIFYNRTKIMYDFGEYDIENGHIFMCIPEDLVKEIYWVPKGSNLIERYLTLVCLVLSVTCLFMVILTYLLFAELRNLPGKNLLSLSVSLFLVQLLWLIPDLWYPITVCYVMAIVKHYLYLVSFVAMATIAWHTHLGFASKNVQSDLSSKGRANRRFCKYTAIVWGLPAIFVAACAVVDQKDVYAVYANELSCWFGNVQAQKYLFVLPVGLLLLFNVIFFILTVYHIQCSQYSARQIRSNQIHRSMLWVYIKLSSLMGFCWLFGFISLLVETPILSYLFVIFASLQGVYIALAFLVKKAVWKKYKKLFGARKNEYRPSYKSTLIKSLDESKETRL